MSNFYNDVLCIYCHWQLVPTAPLVKKDDYNFKKHEKDERVSPKTDEKLRKGQKVPKMKNSRNLANFSFPLFRYSGATAILLETRKTAIAG